MSLYKEDIPGLVVVIVLAALLIGLFTFLGTNSWEQRESTTLYEDGVLVDIVFTPSVHGSGTGVGPSFDLTGNGGIGIAVTSVSVDVPEQHGLLFACQHGKFYIKCDGNKDRMILWKNLAEGTKVTIVYTEVHQVHMRHDFLSSRNLRLVSDRMTAYCFKTAIPQVPK